MIRFLLFVLLASVAFGQLPAKDKVDTKAINIGVKAMVRSEVAQTTSCTQTSIYQEKDMMTTGSTLLSCASTAMGPTKMANLALILPALETCLLTKGTSTTVVGTKVASILKPAIEVIYDKMLARVKADKKVKMVKDQVLNRMYKVIFNNVNRTYVNELCIQIAKSIGQGPFQCVLSKGDGVFDFSSYPCVAAVKSDLLG